MEAKGSSKMLVNVYQTTWHYISEDSKLYKMLVETLIQRNHFSMECDLNVIILIIIQLQTVSFDLKMDK
jgi:hypothetical protein